MVEVAWATKILSFPLQLQPIAFWLRFIWYPVFKAYVQCTKRPPLPHMASTHLCHQISRPPQGRSVCFRRLATSKPSGISLPPPKYVGNNRSLAVRTQTHLKWALRLSIVDQSQPTSTIDMKQLVNFLYDDLPHLFDDQGIDRTAYDDQVKFRDPITKHDSIGGYLFNIGLLKNLFRPHFQLHWVKQV